MIKKLIVENFKSIKRLNLELAPLTILVGPNGSGKSSILEALALMSQSFDKLSILDGRKGPFIEIEDIEALFLKGDTSQWLSLGFEIELRDEEIREICTGLLEDLERREIKDVPERRVFVEQVRDALISQKNSNVVKRVKLRYIYRIRLAPSEENLHFYDINGFKIVIVSISRARKISSIPKKLSVSQYSRFFPDMLYIDGVYLHFYEKVRNVVKKRLEKIYYLSSERGTIPWYKKAEPPNLIYVGRKGERTLELLSRLMRPENDEKRLPYELICKEFGIENIWSGWDRENILTSNYRDPYLGSPHKLPSLGHGSRQLLPIIVQIAYSDAGSIILIDEPEISLHPEYQTKLHMLFGRAVIEGKQVLVTTHSSYFPYSLHLPFEGIKLRGQTTRGEREFEIRLNVNDVKVYHVERDERGYTAVSELELDESGLKEAIPSFSKVEVELLSKFMRGE